MISVQVSGAYRHAALMIQDPLSRDALFVPCALTSNIYQCSYSFAGLALSGSAEFEVYQRRVAMAYFFGTQ